MVAGIMNSRDFNMETGGNIRIRSLGVAGNYFFDILIRELQLTVIAGPGIERSSNMDMCRNILICRLYGRKENKSWDSLICTSCMTVVTW